MEYNNTSNNISVVSYNIRCDNPSDKNEKSWKYRAGLVAEILQTASPSIICMQEVKHSQLKFLKRYLAGYDCVYTFRDNYYLSECLPIFYRTDLYELINFKTFWLSDTPEEMSNTWQGYYFRICTYAVLKEKATNKCFVVANTHLDYKTNEIKLKSVKLINQKLNALSLPTIVMGDFNSTQQNNAIKEMKNYYSDAGTDFEDVNQSTNFSNNKLKKIDYIFQKGFDVINYNVITTTFNGIYASDHFPIYAELYNL